MLKNILERLRLHHKLSVSMLLIGLVPLVFIATVTITLGKSSLVKNITDELQAISGDKAHDVEMILQNNVRETLLLSKHPFVIEALRQFLLRKREDHVKVEKLSDEEKEDVPPIALIRSFRKFTS